MENETKERIKLIQRWIGAPQTGDLNDVATLKELEKDLPGLALHLAKKEITQDESPREYETIRHFTPNTYDDQRMFPTQVVFHHTSGSLEGGIDWIGRPESEVSYHMIIDTNGDRHVFLNFDQIAWHCRGHNSKSVGIAFPGDTSISPLTYHQIKSATEVVQRGAELYGWSLSDIYHHRQLNSRKVDLDHLQFQRLRNSLKQILK